MSRFLTELVVRPYPSTAQCDGRNWVLTQDLLYQSTVLGYSFAVPKGFITDFASVPAVFWAHLPPFGKYGVAAVAHDFLYWSQFCTREDADHVLLEAMTDAGVDSATRLLIYNAVRLGGQHGWAADARAKAAKKEHVS
jgi:hypothetical protein